MNSKKDGDFFQAMATAYGDRAKAVAAALATFDEARARPNVKWIIRAAKLLERAVAKAQAVFLTAVEKAGQEF